ncbi:hypothetical protein LCGC14_2900860, partial [marine sediment metagenome]
MKKNIILIGLGEVGRAIRQIEKEAGNRVYVNDKKHGVEKICTSQTVDVMHICIPYSGDFINDTINFIKGYKPKLTIIHSTVNVGTTEEIFIRINYNFDKFITSEDEAIWNNNVKSVMWKDPNVLFAGTMSRLNQIIINDVDETYSTVVYEPSASIN